jgi:glycerol-3-phosphate acyltransferase PlsX
MRLAIQAVADKQASAIVSSGNTGALMALSTKLLKTLPGIDRPAITSLYPTLTARCVMLDVGANVATDAEQLFQFAVMGRAYARVVFGKESPTIGLLNIGSEEMKGHDVLREAAARFRASFFAQDFKGFVEGTDLSKGTVDVVVTDGFTGNVSIKTTEGFAAMLGKDVKAMLKTSWLAKIGFAIALIPLKKLARKYDPARYNGAMLVGLNGVVIKSHGSATTEGFANAVRVAAQVVRDGMNERVMEAMAQQAPQAASVQTEVMSGA